MELPNGDEYLATDRYARVMYRGSHFVCFSLVPRESYLALLRITKRSFELSSPSKREQGLERELASRLVTTLEQPLDITTNIAQYLTQEYAVAALSSLRPTRRPGYVTLDVSAPIVLRDTPFEGKTYLAFASNAQGPRSQARPRLLFLLEDEFGITGLHVTTSDVHPSVTPSSDVWWKMVTLREDEYIIELYHDVSLGTDSY